MTARRTLKSFISIPHGTIKTSIRLCFFVSPIISIPHGTIKTGMQLFSFDFSLISIPHGTIKTAPAIDVRMQVVEFQFHMVRLRP